MNTKVWWGHLRTVSIGLSPGSIECSPLRTCKEGWKSEWEEELARTELGMLRSNKVRDKI